MTFSTETGEEKPKPGRFVGGEETSIPLAIHHQGLHMKRLLALLILLILGVLLVTLSPSQTKRKAPNFALRAANGKTYELSKMKGKVVVVNFWATWCGPCKREIPDFTEVFKNYKNKGVEIVGISLDQGGWDDVLPFLKTNSINYPIVIGSDKLASEFGDVQYIPTTFFVDKNGYIVGQQIGGMTKSQLESKIKSLL
jgi:thiol-disulfide isomerase/thioredoxin